MEEADLPQLEYQLLSVAAEGTRQFERELAALVRQGWTVVSYSSFAAATSYSAVIGPIREALLSRRVR